jgi:hypothetical protein
MALYLVNPLVAEQIRQQRQEKTMARLLRPPINPEQIARAALPDNARVLGIDRARDPRQTQVFVQSGAGSIASLAVPNTHLAGVRPSTDLSAEADIIGAAFDPGRPSSPNDALANLADAIIPIVE